MFARRVSNSEPKRQGRAGQCNPAVGLGAIFVFSAAVNILLLTGPVFMLQIYDRVLPSRSLETLLALLFLVCILFALVGILDAVRSQIACRMGAQLQTALDLRSGGPLSQPVHAAGSRSPFALTGSVDTFLSAPVFLGLFDLIWVPLFLGVMFVFHPALGWFALGGAGIFVSVSALNNRITSERACRADEAANLGRYQTAEAIAAREIILSQAMADTVATRWQDQQREISIAKFGVSSVRGCFTAALKAFRQLMHSGVLALGAFLVLRAEMSAGGIFAASIVLGRIIAPLDAVMGQVPLVRGALDARRAYVKGRHAQKPDQSVDDPAIMPRDLGVNNVCVAARKGGRPVLNAVSLALAPGQVVGVIGPNGAGKTVLARTLMGLCAPDSGFIVFGDRRLDQYRADQLGCWIGYLPQSLTFFDTTISQNIARLDPLAAPSDVFRAARRAHVHDMILSLPHGYDTRMSACDSHLSGGQLQRIALARALFSDPVVLVLDEPDSALDTEGAMALSRAINQFRQEGHAAIVLTHRMSAVSDCDTLVVLERGQIVSSGPRNAVLQRQLQTGAARAASRQVS